MSDQTFEVRAAAVLSVPRKLQWVMLVLQDLLRLPGVEHAEVWFFDPRDAAQKLRERKVTAEQLPLRGDEIPWPIDVKLFAAVGQVLHRDFAEVMERHRDFVAKLSDVRVRRRGYKPVSRLLVVDRVEHRGKWVTYQVMTSGKRRTAYGLPLLPDTYGSYATAF
ncbi:MAG TPA: hypothetical protein VGN72_19815 [Tepidisphaeraceae bacterium]|jgi:hypothetical protein|nr:hypothetical protein [Tepidisphaeraceae bacterium]